MDRIERLHQAVRDVQDFPKEGIVFKDITPILGDAELLDLSADLLVEELQRDGEKVSKVIGIDARGFIFGSMVALKLGAGFVPVRKAGKLPWRTHRKEYQLEYGNSAVEIHQDALQPGERVVMVDDLLATGGTARAAADLVQGLGAELVSIVFLIELEFLKGRERFDNVAVRSILKY